MFSDYRLTNVEVRLELDSVTWIAYSGKEHFQHVHTTLP